MTSNYYDKHLSAERLRLAYDLATPRIRQYLDAEIAFVLGWLTSSDSVLELGCGYGRVLKRLASKANQAVGIDTSRPSLKAISAQEKAAKNILLAQMDAAALAFRDATFNKVICIQNGISAFHVDPQKLIHESLRIIKPGGLALFSSYSAKIWDERLEWFRIKSKQGLLGELDMNKTGDGIIACRDGFLAVTYGPDDFKALVEPFGLPYEILEIDESSIFCVIKN